MISRIFFVYLEIEKYKYNMIALKKLLVFILVFAILIVLKEIFSFVVAYKNDKHIDMSLKRQLVIASAISYIITIICTGFQIF